MITHSNVMYFYSKHKGPAKLFDESEERARLQERQKLFKDYRTKRQEVMQVRNADREQRNQAKVKQLEQAEQWQVYKIIIVNTVLLLKFSMKIIILLELCRIFRG